MRFFDEIVILVSLRVPKVNAHSATNLNKLSGFNGIRFEKNNLLKWFHLPKWPKTVAENAIFRRNRDFGQFKSAKCQRSLCYESQQIFWIPWHIF